MRKRKTNNNRKIIIYGIIMLLLAILGLEFIFIQNLGTQGSANTNSTVKSTDAGVDSASSSAGVQTDVNNNQGPQPGNNTQSSDSTGSNNNSNGNNNNDPDAVKLQMSDMSLEEKVGQLVIVGVDGYENNENSRKLMKNYHVGGFILFKKNIRDSEQMLNLLNSLKDTNSDNKVPLFLSIDEEGGRVSRLPDQFKKFPTNRVIGKRDDSDFSHKVGRILGKELNLFGLNMDFAPVLDINSNPQNPVIGDRSFGTTSELVSKLGVATMKGIQEQKVISVVKHFPGHGDTSVDSHVGLPRVNHDMKRLESFELKPFAAAIEKGADAVMVAHILLPKLDSKNPASFSKAIISDTLRDKMNFNGVVITDDFTMGAISKNYDMGTAAVKSIQAGGDIVLVCHQFDKQIIVLDALLNAVKSGKISAERLDESVYRILSLKQKYALTDEAVGGPVEYDRINNEINNLLQSLF